MGLLQALVICFIAYLIYKAITGTSRGLSKEEIDKLRYEMSTNISEEFKKSALKNKETALTYFDDLRSGDPLRVEQALYGIEAIFDEDVASAEKNISEAKDIYQKTLKP